MHKIPREMTEENIKNAEMQEEEGIERQEAQGENENLAENNVEEAELSDEEKLKAEIEELKDKNLRVNAEFDNFRKRMTKERVELIQTAGRGIIEKLLDVLDDCDRTEQIMQDKTQDIDAVREGMQLVIQKFRRVLEQQGLKSMDSQGQDFNVELHEAITEIPAPDKKSVGKIVDVIHKGYYLNDKIIRYAKVVVGK